jgi:hypothetical protein
MPPIQPASLVLKFQAALTSGNTAAKVASGAVRQQAKRRHRQRPAGPDAAADRSHVTLRTSQENR